MVDTTSSKASNEAVSARIAEAGAPEITDAMVEAGVKAFRANETTDPINREIAEAVREIFTAMSLASYP
jgi:hypothetical protein